MLLSIIVPVYNMAGGGKLQKCMESLMAQELTDFEVIAVDDKSQDESARLLYQLKQKYGERLKVILSPENRRQGGARNLGLAQAQGEWIGFVDSDDWVARDMYPKLLRRAAETNADIVGCDLLITDETGKEEGTPVRENTPEQTGVLDECKRKRLVLEPGSMVVKIYKRALFAEHQIMFPEKMFYEDNAIAALPFLYAARFERVEECLYFYYQHSASTVHSVSLAKCRDRMRAMEIFADECRKRGFAETFAEEIGCVMYELGYRNTLFSYLQAKAVPDIRFLMELKRYLKRCLPEPADNPYFQARNDAEVQKLTKLHRKNSLLFLGYYKLLYWYRSVRSIMRKRKTAK